MTDATSQPSTEGWDAIKQDEVWPKKEAVDQLCH